MIRAGNSASWPEVLPLQDRSTTWLVPWRIARIRIRAPALRASNTHCTWNGRPAVAVGPSGSRPLMVESEGSTSTASTVPALCGAVAWQFAGLTGDDPWPPPQAAASTAACTMTTSEFRMSSKNATAVVRPARLDDAPGIARVQVISWRTTYPGMIPQDYLDSMDEALFVGRWSERLRHESSRRATFVAEDDGRLVGFATGGPEREGDARYHGELYAIYILQEWQGEGLGRELADAVAGVLVERGLRSMLVWVLRDNHAARAFYERLGGVYVREHPLDFGAGFEVMEISYGWDDVRDGLA